MKRRVGRPSIYTNDVIRVESRREQNRTNQRRCRERKKLLQKLSEYSTTSLTEEEYRSGIVSFQNQFDYDYFFTGTVDLNQMERDQLNTENRYITDLNQQYELELGFKTERRIGLNTLRKYTERYLQHLTEKNLFERCFVVFEQGKNNKYHTHILFKSNPEKINFDITSENSWLLGKCITVPVENRIQLLSYMVKELKPFSSSNKEQRKIDNWFISGDFSEKSKPVLPNLLTETVHG